MTLEDIGHEVGVTRERVRQIELRALTKMAAETQLAQAA
jgi:DNA-directed RNA polymerase sigma subunit (sigma70/sigma32)